MRHCIHQWLLQWACWVHYQGLTTLHKLCSYCEHVRHQWCVAKKLGQIFVRSWNSRPEPSRCQCTIMVRGTVFTNDCCSWPDKSLPRFETTLHKLCNYCEHVRHQWCVANKLGQILVRSWNSHPEPSRCQCTIIVWGTVFTNDCCSRLVVSITKVWQPFTSCVATVNMSDINDVLPKS